MACRSPSKPLGLRVLEWPRPLGAKREFFMDNHDHPQATLALRVWTLVDQLDKISATRSANRKV
jgi:hypothetical protein